MTQAPVVVPVRSAWASRINQIALGVFGLVVPLTALAPVLPEPWKSRALAAVSVIGAVAVWYYRTFATASVTPSAAASSSTTTPSLTQVLSATEASLKAAGVNQDSIADSLTAAAYVATKSQ